ncbi:MAG: AAA family ATPase [Janthinobacterium lividum]
MRIRDLKIRNIGPFLDSKIEFISDEDRLKYPPVIIITGENGTGKSIILDAIRSLFIGVFGEVEREITSATDFFIGANIVINKNKRIELKSNSKQEGGSFLTNDMEFNKIFRSQFQPNYKKDFILEYWTSKLSNDKFNINNIQALGTNNYLDDALTGIHKNVDVTKIISFFDYLKDSRETTEKELGESLYNLLEEIINLSISEGKLSHVSRVTLTPIIKVLQREVSLDKLSSGNLYLIQRFTSLLRQVYAICSHNNIPIQEYKQIEGLLLIDEAENHLHPKWQKVFLRNILKLFPKLQIIITTHSPFIVSSISNARVYVCSNQIDHSEIVEESDFYANSPIEEILRSPLFDTNSFNIDISQLLQQRKLAIESKDNVLKKEIEEKLLVINPEYFNYFNINEIIRNL